MAKEESIIQTKKKLQQIVDLQHELDDLQEFTPYDVNSSYVDWSKEVNVSDVEDFVDERVDCGQRPERKTIEMPEAPRSSLLKNFHLSAVVLFFIGLIAVPVISYLIVNNLNYKATLDTEIPGGNADLIYPSIFLALGCFFLIYSIVLMIKNKMFVDISGKKSKQKYNLAVLEAEEIDKYNRETYPRLLQEYEQNSDSLRQEFVAKVNETHQNIHRIKIQIKTLDIVSEKYAPYAQELLYLIEDGRADNIKEAINILVQEQKEAEYRNALIEQEKVKNEILANEIKTRQEEERRHNKEMERASYQQASAMQQQAKEIEKQTNYAKQQVQTSGQNRAAVRCLNCRRMGYCTKDPRYCGQYSPKEGRV